MQITKEANGLSVFRTDCFSVADTLKCGQLFRFVEKNGEFEVWSSDKFCRVYERGERIFIDTEYPEYFSGYFAFDEDYEGYYDALCVFPELRESATASRGVRLLRQDAFEMILSFIISANNNIPRIKLIISRLCEKAGSKTSDGYAFPTREGLLPLTSADYFSLGAGYRAPYLEEAVKVVTPDFISEVKSLPTENALKKLLTVKGVGPKVADCILLFGLGRWDTFPVDTWMEQELKTAELDTNKKIREYYLARYGKLSGLAQQYIYHYARNVKGKR